MRSGQRQEVRDDDDNGRYISGTYASGKGTMLGAILATIISFESIVR